MAKGKTVRTIEEINKKICSGKVVVVTADEMTKIVKSSGAAKAAREVDVVTTGTFAPMCSSGALINFGHSKPGIKVSKVWFNDVPAYGGLAAVDTYIGATEPVENDPLNKVYPGLFPYGGGHVIEDLIAGKKVELRATAYGTHCYPKTELKKKISIDDLPYAMLLNPRNCYQNYNCAINLGKKTIYTYMGILKPDAANANFSTSGELSPLFNDPFYRTLGMGTKVFIGGAQGYIVTSGTQHNPDVPRNEFGIPLRPSGTLMVMGDMKAMDARWVRGVSFIGYGCSLSLGVGIPIPILDEDMARYAGISDEDIYTQVIDYNHDYPNGKSKPLAKVSYAQLKSGCFEFNGKKVNSAPLSSHVMALEIANVLKQWIESGEFTLISPAVPFV